MDKRFGRWMMAALAGVALAAGLLAWTQRDGDGQQAPASAAPPAPRPAMPMAPAAPPAPAPAPAANEELPLDAQVGHLLASHDPADALRAYWLVADCAKFNAEHDRVIFDLEELKHWKRDSVPGLRGMTEREKQHDARLCGPMTERQRQARLDYLAIALKAGVPGAATAFVDAGPFGDPSALQTRPDDPLVKEWKARARTEVARAADSGTDVGALHLWAFQNQAGSDITEKNPALAYPYMLAIGLIQADLLGADDLLAKVYAQDSDLMTALAAELTPEQRAAGVAAARRIAELAKASRKRPGRAPGA